MVPLTREEHERAHEGDPWINQFIEANAPAYFRRVYAVHAGGSNYLGPGDLVAEVGRQVRAEVEQQRRALGLA